MKYLIIGDQHVADRAPSSRKDTYRQDILDKLIWIIEEANRQEVDAVLNLGDVFHVKRPDRNSHALVNEVAEIFGASKSPVIICPGNHDLCVTDDTEALTDRGWKTVHELDGTEKFATLNRETRHLEYHLPLGITHMPYSGKAYHFNSRSVDLVTTPNHRWWGSWKKHKRELRVKTSEQLSSSPGWYLPSVEGWGGISNPDTVRIGKHDWPSKLAARFFGWFVSEGTVCSREERVTISQDKKVNPDHYQEIWDLCVDLGLNPKGRSNMIRFSDHTVAKVLASQFGYATSKDVRIPRWLIDWSPELLTEFLWAYFRGDGTINGSKEERQASNYGTSSVVATTANSGLADDLSEIGVRLGYKMHKGAMKEFPFGEDYLGHALRLGFSKKRTTSTLPTPQTIELEDQMVWCPTVPNEIWLARRNGVMTWTGNTMDRLDSIPNQPLGTLALHPNVELLIGASDDFPVYSVPYVDPTEENLRFWTDKYQSEGGPSEYPMLLTHQAIFPKKEEPIYPWVSAEDWAQEFGAKYTAYGHIHSRMKAGPFYDIGGTTFCNNGAISRGSLHEETINRKLAVTLFDDSEQVGKKAFTSIPIPYKPAAEVFDLEAVAISKGNEAKIDAFLGSLKSSELKHLTIETVLDSARSNPNLGKEAVLELEDIVTQVMTN